MSNTTTINVTYSCKHCKRVLQVTYPIRTETREWHGSNYVTARYALVNTAFCRELKISDKPGGGFLDICTCGKYMAGKEITGTVKESIPCDRKCTGAKGHVCECSCGGRNHGAVYRIT